MKLITRGAIYGDPVIFGMYGFPIILSFMFAFLLGLMIGVCL